MEPLWTLPELVAEVATRIAALPAPKNGQVRAVPDERTVRYYVTLGLLDRPSTMRGRTALYGQKHVAQVVAIKRLQAMGRSLSEIQTLWATLDDPTLARMSGMELPAKGKPPARAAFWKREARPDAPPDQAAAGSGEQPAGTAHATKAPPLTGSEHTVEDAWAADAAAAGAVRGVPRAAKDAEDAGAGVAPGPAPGAPAAVELRVELAPQVVLSLSITDESVAISPADVRAIRAAAAPLLAELASRRLASHSGGEEP